MTTCSFLRRVSPASILLIIICLLQPSKSFSQAIEVGAGKTGSGTLMQGSFITYFANYDNKIFRRSGPIKRRKASYILPCPGDRARFVIPGFSHMKVSLFHEQGEKESIHYVITGIDLALYYKILQIRDVIRFHVKGGLTGSIDRLKIPIELLADQQTTKRENYSETKYGLLGGLETDIHVLPSLWLVVGGDQRYLFNNTGAWGNTRWQAYAGLRYKFN